VAVFYFYFFIRETHPSILEQVELGILLYQGTTTTTTAGRVAPNRVGFGDAAQGRHAGYRIVAAQACEGD